jgi:hypothetical protein
MLVIGLTLGGAVIGGLVGIWIGEKTAHGDYGEIQIIFTAPAGATIGAIVGAVVSQVV